MMNELLIERQELCKGDMTLDDKVRIREIEEELDIPISDRISPGFINRGLVDELEE